MQINSGSMCPEGSCVRPQFGGFETWRVGMYVRLCVYMKTKHVRILKGSNKVGHESECLEIVGAFWNWK